MEYGGIYLDIDVLTLRSFDPLLNLSDVVMAHESDMEQSACNAVILAKKKSAFLRRWYEAYQSFNQSCWGCHSILLPGELASIYPEEVTILPTYTFFRPSWNETKLFHESNDFNFSLNYATHLWNKVSYPYLEQLTPDIAVALNTTLGQMIRQAVGNSTLYKLKQMFLSNPSDWF
ncbi:unnamed protein product [Rotaria magnacalcarata]